ncbi:MAG: peptidyl-prolyl cis-trans isomerase [Oenococcus sp.]|uniref:peptidyl-prolyl cis-trans isomerase n=1 Tax=Oenococcus sp. TaxID=1979414 RepID=UPI0039E796A3
MRKFVWTAVVLLFLAGVAYLTLNTSKVLVTSRGGAVTEAQYMSSVTATSTGQQIFVGMVINNSLEHLYGNSVSSTEVNRAYQEQRAQYGSSWSAFLSQQGTTASQFRGQIRTQLLLVEAAKNYHKISASQLQKAYKNYTPRMNVSIITVANSKDADTVLKNLKAGRSFASQAKSHSTNTATASKGGRMPSFDSTSTALAPAIVSASAKLKVGTYTTSAVQTGSEYAIIRLNSKAKKQSLNSYRTILTNSLINSWVNNSNNTQKVQRVISRVLNKNNVQFKGKQYPALQNAIQQYLVNTSSSSSSSSSLPAPSGSSSKNSSSTSSSSSSESSSTSSSKK